MTELHNAGNGIFSIRDDITVDTVPALWAQSRKLFPPNDASSITINVDAITDIDSSGVALLVAWSRWATCNEKTFFIAGYSAKLAKLIENNNLEKILKLTA